MIIERIDLENFMCYYGKNTFEFNEGINIVIGDNGYGKSKLYDAFYWVMYDRVFVSERKEFVNTNDKNVKSKIISDKAKFETDTGEISTIVSISFRDTKKNETFILERKYTIKKNHNEILDNYNSELTILKKESAYLNAKNIKDIKEQEVIINKILPPSIKDYMWFQGEQVESIIDFKKQDTLTKAINALSDITIFDRIQEYTKSLAKIGAKEYEKELKKLSTNIEKSDFLEKEKQRLEKIIDQLSIREKEDNEQLSIAEEKCDELLNKIEDANKINALLQKKEMMISNCNDLRKALEEEQFKYYKKMFKNKWILKGTQNFQSLYADKFAKYENIKLQLAETKRREQEKELEVEKKLQTRLPIDVPEPIYVQRMLDEEICLVCNRKAEKNSDAWNKIKELIDRPVVPQKNNSIIKKEAFILHTDLKKLYQNGLSLSHRLREIDDDIQDTLSNQLHLKEKINDCESEILSIQTTIETLLSDISLSEIKAKEIIHEYSASNRHVRNFSEKLTKTKQEMEFNKASLQKIEKEFALLVTGEIPKSLEIKKDTLNELEEIATSTRERVFNNLIAQLEREANEHYESMTSGNKSMRGKINLRKLPNGDYMPEVIDQSGKTLLGSNTSNLILVKVATIMAIVTAKNSADSNLYTLITDAPTSVFGESYTLGFCKRVSKVYRQSIILSKEFFKNKSLLDELLNDPEIKRGKIYRISPTISDAERNSRENLATKIEALN